MLKRFLIAIAVALTISGCSTSKDTELAEKKVAEFHSLLDTKRFGEIYATSADDLRTAAKEQEFLALLEAVNRKLGTVKQADRQAWNVNYHTSGVFVTLTYKTAYTEGDASEQFIYRITDGQAKLVGYHVNSNVLITK